MKKLIVACSILLIPSLGMCLPQPQNLGNVKVDAIALPVVTIAAMDLLTPDTTGQIIYVSDSKFGLCISTGAQSLARGAWIVSASTVPASNSVGAGTGNPMHCQ